jgi:hypothetical protein
MKDVDGIELKTLEKSDESQAADLPAKAACSQRCLKPLKGSLRSHLSFLSAERVSTATL